MSEQSPQSLSKHARFDPPYHFVLTFFFFANIVFAIVQLWRHPTVSTMWYLALSLAVIIPLVKLRSYPLKVQDRVIRLEERLRLQALAPAEWHAQMYRLTEDQLIGLRFAGDDEVVQLAKLALEENLTRKQIKERIENWRPDNWRV
jgi:hypothetical protein